MNSAAGFEIQEPLSERFEDSASDTNGPKSPASKKSKKQGDLVSKKAHRSGFES